ncbi:unannotated protein [freshwater metagenome]|uniref:Unannotated protein n=1 Tax=freshwater metagenome TaxID=449393 RepID=A0A6J6YX13_9ZZZZ
MFEAQRERVVLELQLAYAGSERQPEELRDLRRNLPGVGIDRVTAEQDEVVAAEHLNRAGKCLRGGPRVAAGERGIGDVHAVICAERDGFAQHVLGAGRPERDHGERAARGLCELVALGHGAPAVVVHVQLDTVALQASVGAQRERLDFRDLLDERSDPERLGHREELRESG